MPKKIIILPKKQLKKKESEAIEKYFVFKPMNFELYYLLFFNDILLDYFFSFYSFESNIGTLSVDGSPNDGITPKIVLPESEKEEDMLLVRLETNPLDKNCDTRIIVESRPLQIVYDLVRKTNVSLL